MAHSTANVPGASKAFLRATRELQQSTPTPRSATQGLPARHVNKKSLTAGVSLPDFAPERGVDRRLNWFQFNESEALAPLGGGLARGRRQADEPEASGAADGDSTRVPGQGTGFASHHQRIEQGRTRRRQQQLALKAAQAEPPGMRVASSHPIYNELLIELPPMGIAPSHPLGLCQRCGHGAELCLRCTNHKQYEEVTQYKEERAHGAVYLFNKAIARGHETLLTIVFRMWRNGVSDRHRHEARMQTIIMRWQKRAMWVPFSKWMTFVQIQRRQRTTEWGAKLELENESLRNRLDEAEAQVKELSRENVQVKQQIYEVQEAERKKQGQLAEDLRRVQNELSELKRASGKEELTQQRTYLMEATEALMVSRFQEMEELFRTLDTWPRQGLFDVHSCTADRTRAMLELRDEPPRNVVRNRLPKDAQGALEILKPSGLGQYAPVDRVLQVLVEWVNAALLEAPDDFVRPIESLLQLGSMEHYPVFISVLLSTMMSGAAAPPQSTLVAAAQTVSQASTGSVTADDVARFRTQVNREPEAVEKAALIVTTCQRWFGVPPELVVPEELVSEDVTGHVRLLSNLYCVAGVRFGSRDSLLNEHATELLGLRRQWESLVQERETEALAGEDLAVETRLASDMASLARVFCAKVDDARDSLNSVWNGHALWVKAEKALLRALVVDMATRMRGMA